MLNVEDCARFVFIEHFLNITFVCLSPPSQQINTKNSFYSQDLSAAQRKDK